MLFKAKWGLNYSSSAVFTPYLHSCWRMIRTWCLKKELASHLTRKGTKNGWKPFVPSYDHSTIIFCGIFFVRRMLHYQSSRVWQTKALFQFTRDEEHLSPHTMYVRMHTRPPLGLCSRLMISPFRSWSSFVFALVNRVSHYSDCSVGSTGDYYLITNPTGKTERETSFELFATKPRM